MAVKPANPKYAAKPYEQMQHPGQRIQIDVKFVPSVCLVNGAKGQRFYQYTAIDEFSRWRFVEAFEEHSSYSSAGFCKNMCARSSAVASMPNRFFHSFSTILISADEFLGVLVSIIRA